ncbi:hypothetical protein J6590_030928 [Homalodisca vitripennis]|nr:hypothetical protein J6590_030928 [Homalodisca vitripennis]
MSLVVCSHGAHKLPNTLKASVIRKRILKCISNRCDSDAVSEICDIWALRRGAKTENRSIKQGRGHVQAATDRHARTPTRHGAKQSTVVRTCWVELSWLYRTEL